MRKITSLMVAAVLVTLSAVAQPVSDRAVIPVAVTLNQILRLNVVDGGNVEFVFNNIADYKAGLSGSPEYQTDFNVASSTAWSLLIYAEDATFTGNDDPGNTMPLGYVGFSIINNGGAHDFGTEITANNNVNVSANVLGNAASTLIGCTGSTAAAVNCAGDIDDNSLRIMWQAGTGSGDMIQTSFIDAGLNPDRYTNNVFLDLVTSGI